MPLDKALLDILVCPVDRGPLLLVGTDVDGVLYNPRLHKAYRIDGGIPVLLPDESRDVSEDEHRRLTESG